MDGDLQAGEARVSWVRRLLAHFPQWRRAQVEELRRAHRVTRVIGENDPVMREYKKLDGALVIRVERKPR